ncbi:MAG: DNA-binding response regulator [Acidobacteria bacterium]|nr:MAG: DNA-binding response regulator [Acidobacteriota bacterium]
MAIRILIADDHGLLRAGLRALLNAEEGFAVLGAARDSAEALELSTRLRPDIVLMDISMPGGGGIEATRQLKGTLPSVRVLILTIHEDKGLLREAIQAGADGYILKRALESELITAIQAVMRGDLYVHPAMTRVLLAEQTSKPTSSTLVEPLTNRELDVLRLIVQGYTNRQMADRLNLSIRTVESHRANLMDKLGLHSRVELVRYATENRLLDEP